MNIRNRLALCPEETVLPFPQKGLLVVCGPPLGGKGPLAARIEELLPNALKIESVDNLAHEGQMYLSRSGSGVREAEPALLREASRVWRNAETVPPLVIISARFATPAIRREAADFASAQGTRFLLIEALSAPIRSLRRISRLMLSSQETVLRLARYERARNAYQPTTAKERARLPALAFKSVLSHLEDVAERIVAEWCAL